MAAEYQVGQKVRLWNRTRTAIQVATILDYEGLGFYFVQFKNGQKDVVPSVRFIK